MPVGRDRVSWLVVCPVIPKSLLPPPLPAALLVPLVVVSQYTYCFVPATFRLPSNPIAPPRKLPLSLLPTDPVE